jgi:hypothetical protein
MAEEGTVLPNGCWSRIVENLWLAGWLAAGFISCPRVLRRPSIYLENDSSVSTSYLVRAQTELHMKNKSISQTIQTLYLGTSTKSVHNTNSDAFDNHT